MRDQELVNAIRRLKVETGSLACMGCGHENNCGVSGCAVMREAADRIANQSTHVAALQQEIEKLRGQNEQLREAAALVTKESAELLERRWIPVEERLPETQGWYHVAIRDEKTKKIAVALDLYAVETAKNFGHEIGFCKDGRWDGREKVIAWMPLPEPPEVENAETK